MKTKLLCSLLLVGSFMLYSVPVNAEDLDIAGMDTSALSELKQRVDEEYYSRLKSEPITLVPGEYSIGTDIDSGEYYIAMVEPNESGSVSFQVYPDKEPYESEKDALFHENILENEKFALGGNTKEITLNDGYYIIVQDGPLMVSTSDFDPSEYYPEYEAPEGTRVPAGVYFVGNEEDSDIPSGRYTIYPATIMGAYVKIYYSKEAYHNDTDEYDSGELAVTEPLIDIPIVLEEGSVIIFNYDVILKKQTVDLSFD